MADPAHPTNDDDDRRLSARQRAFRAVMDRYYAALRADQQPQQQPQPQPQQPRGIPAALWARLSESERAWVREHPDDWRVADTGPKPEQPVTGLTVMSYGDESALYGGDADEYATTAAFVESYTPVADADDRPGPFRLPDEDPDLAPGAVVEPVLGGPTPEMPEMPPTPVAIPVAVFAGDAAATAPVLVSNSWASFLQGHGLHARANPRREAQRAAWRRDEAAREEREREKALKRPPLLDTRQAADRLGLTTSAVRQLVRRHGLPIWKIDGKNWYALSDLLTYAERVAA